MSTSCVRHAAHKGFFILHDDFLDIGKMFCPRQVHKFATCLRVLETWTNDRIKVLSAAGCTEIHEEDLWLDVTWAGFGARSLWLFSARSFRAILPRVIKAGLARQRYIRRDTNGGVIAIYETYELARADHQYPGEIIHQVLFVSEKVNDLIGGREPGGKGPEEEKDEGAQRGDQAGSLSTTEQPSRSKAALESARGGNPETDQESSDETISSHWQNCQGERVKNLPLSYGTEEAAGNSANGGLAKRVQGSRQNCQPPVGNSASNKNRNKNLEESLKGLPNSAQGAIKLSLSQFDFSQEPSPTAILQLADILLPSLPERYACEVAFEDALSRIYDAAVTIASLPLVRARGLRHVAREMAYRADESSPCTWRSHCRADNTGFVVRLWHLASEPGAWKCAQEMDRWEWWPEYLRPVWYETPPDIDLAELAGVDPHERFGMDQATAYEMEAYLAGLLFPHGYEVRRWRLDVSRAHEHGYAIEVWFQHDDGRSRILRFYTPEQWDLIVQADEVAPLGSLEFVRHLAKAVHAQQIA